MLTLTILLIGCASGPESSGNSTAYPFQQSSPSLDASITSHPAGTAVSSPTPERATSLIVWMPASLSPGAESPAGELLRKRLIEFESQYHNLQIEIRIKAEYGAGGLLDSLTTANAAAPAALPDLVALPRELEEEAALKGLLLPLDDLTTALEEPDWYPYALELAYLQNNLYGLPMAGDALIQIYHSEPITNPIKSWSALVQSGQTLLFPAASEEALFTLALYQANGGLPYDQQGLPTLTVPELEGVLDFYHQALQTGSMPGEQLAQLQNDQSVWDAFNEGRGQVVISWTSRYLQNPNEQNEIAPIPTPDGKPFSLAKGWVWSVAGRDEEKRRLAVRLAEYLTDAQFLAAWSQSAGYLPPRPSSLSLWTDPDLASSLESILSAAVLLPPTDILSALETPLQQATIAIMRNQNDPSAVAQQASASLRNP